MLGMQMSCAANPYRHFIVFFSLSHSIFSLLKEMNPILFKSIARINDSLGTTPRQTLIHRRLPLVPFPVTKPAVEELNGHTDASEVLAGRFIETGRMCPQRRTEALCCVRQGMLPRLTRPMIHSLFFLVTQCSAEPQTTVGGCAVLGGG